MCSRARFDSSKTIYTSRQWNYILQVAPVQAHTSHGYQYPSPSVKFVSPQTQPITQKLVPSQGYQYPVPQVPFTPPQPQQPIATDGYKYPVPRVPLVIPQPLPTVTQSQGYSYPVPNVPLPVPQPKVVPTAAPSQGYSYPVPSVPLLVTEQKPAVTTASPALIPVDNTNDLRSRIDVRFGDSVSNLVVPDQQVRKTNTERESNMFWPYDLSRFHRNRCRQAMAAINIPNQMLHSRHKWHGTDGHVNESLKYYAMQIENV